jgi:pimeloyl-ACP methyl ester carboxylesterase
MIAQTWAHRNPSRVTHLILCGTTPPDPARLPSHRNALRILPWIPSFAMKLLLRVMLRAVFRKVRDPRWLIEYQDLSERFTKKDLLSRYRVAMDFDSARMPDFPAPGKVLILEGEQDRFVKPSMRQMLRLHYPEAQAYLFKKAGHSLMMTHSEEWSRIVSGFLLV